MDVLNEHVGGEDEILTSAWTKDGSVVSDAKHESWSGAGAAADAFDQLPLVQLNASGEYQP
jgi:hypothetical protein